MHTEINKHLIKSSLQASRSNTFDFYINQNITPHNPIHIIRRRQLFYLNPSKSIHLLKFPTAVPVKNRLNSKIVSPSATTSFHDALFIIIKHSLILCINNMQKYIRLLQPHYHWPHQYCSIIAISSCSFCPWFQSIHPVHSSAISS